MNIVILWAAIMVTLVEGTYSVIDCNVWMCWKGVMWEALC